MQTGSGVYISEQLAVYTKNYLCELGSGGYGVVYEGELPNGLLVAAKVLKVSMNKKVQEAFMAEIGTIGRTYHVHLVRLHGFCFDANTKALVYEFLENGSLEKYLYGDEGSTSTRLEWGTLHSIAVGTAKGIRYLHEECQQRIVHYDIKPANILLTADYTPKVPDFGLARLGERENTHMSLTGGGRGTPGYAALELWMALPASEKCDVYSFGMVLFEILGQRRNYDPGHGESKEWFPRWAWEKYEQREIEDVVSASRTRDGEQSERTKCAVMGWNGMRFDGAEGEALLNLKDGWTEIRVRCPLRARLVLRGHGRCLFRQGWAPASRSVAAASIHQSAVPSDAEYCVLPARIGSLDFCFINQSTVFGIGGGMDHGRCSGAVDAHAHCTMSPHRRSGASQSVLAPHGVAGDLAQWPVASGL
ncbi:G-type lectin S-receptor-like serine/threonine-protein kinase SD2-5 [Miscanthus floridulus]|uniref:G-type lectin S-receptor-like serine/threonine-protein kinase SD2-5 n=1 Tax=Miscanthus floridulus TaxID=154761 RepID=UPI0034575437